MLKKYIFEISFGLIERFYGVIEMQSVTQRSMAREASRYSSQGPGSNFHALSVLNIQHLKG